MSMGLSQGAEVSSPMFWGVGSTGISGSIGLGIAASVMLSQTKESLLKNRVVNGV